MTAVRIACLGAFLAAVLGLTAETGNAQDKDASKMKFEVYKDKGGVPLAAEGRERSGPRRPAARATRPRPTPSAAVESVQKAGRTTR